MLYTEKPYLKRKEKNVNVILVNFLTSLPSNCEAWKMNILDIADLVAVIQMPNINDLCFKASVSEKAELGMTRKEGGATES